MIKLEEHKHDTENKPIKKISLPSRVYIPLSQHVGKICIPEVKIGDSVFTGQKIAQATAQIYAPVHASLSGKVVSLEDWPHPVLGRCKTIIIESDGLDRVSGYRVIRSSEEVSKLAPEQIRNIVFEAGIVGMGGAAFPTHIKLNPPKPVDTLIINGAECESYLTTDYRLMIEQTKEILQGIELAARCLGVKKIYIAIEDNKPEAIKTFRKGLDTLHITHYTLHILKSYYPQGSEKQLIKNILGKEVPSGKLPFDIGVVVHNVATVFAIYEAVYLNKPLYERVVTVTGSCLANPKNVLVRIGTPIKELIDFCGPLKEEPTKIIMGGPMMGIAQYTDEVPVIKQTTGIILFTKSQIELATEEFCLHCGECILNCPMGIYPNFISLATEIEKWDLAKDYGALDCIECGLCNYLCPSKRMLVQSIKKAKLKISEATTQPSKQGV